MHPEEVRQLVTTLRTQHTPVRSARTWKDGERCVGGIFCHALFDAPNFEAKPEPRFPIPEHLAARLRQCNPQLTRKDAGSFALAIICHNTAGLFAQAWAAVEEALTSGEHTK